MDKNSTYSDCEMKYVREEGLDPSQAAEICANREGRGGDEVAEKLNEEESRDFYLDE